MVSEWLLSRMGGEVGQGELRGQSPQVGRICQPWSTWLLFPRAEEWLGLAGEGLLSPV